jgi:hypothetical protein
MNEKEQAKYGFDSKYGPWTILFDIARKAIRRQKVIKKNNQNTQNDREDAMFFALIQARKIKVHSGCLSHPFNIKYGNYYFVSDSFANFIFSMSYEIGFRRRAHGDKFLI